MYDFLALPVCRACILLGGVVGIHRFRCEEVLVNPFVVRYVKTLSCSCQARTSLSKLITYEGLDPTAHRRVFCSQDSKCLLNIVCEF